MSDMTLRNAWKTKLRCPKCNWILYKHPFDSRGMFRLHSYNEKSQFPEHDTYLVYECRQGHLWVVGLDIAKLYEWKE